MEYREFRKTGANISLLGFGAMRFPTAPDGAIDEKAAMALLQAAYDGGVNYYDTAYPYHDGASEPFLGRALKAWPRESFHLATKLPLWNIKTAGDALRIFDEQLARCQTEYFDYYLFHAFDADTFAMVEKLGIYDLLDQKRKDGQIRNLGFSFHDEPPVLARICDAHQWDFAQLQLNYLDWEMQDGKTAYHTLESRGIPCVVMEPVRGGRLADLSPEVNAMLKAQSPQRSIASWAMRYIGALPGVMCVLSGMSAPEQVTDNLATFDRLEPLSETELTVLEKAITRFREYAVVPCTACRYCMPCPAGVDIPGSIKLYNDHVFDGDGFNLSQTYVEFPKEANAGNCVACGKCEAVCPQHIGISEVMGALHRRATGG